MESVEEAQTVLKEYYRKEKFKLNKTINTARVQLQDLVMKERAFLKSLSATPRKFVKPKVQQVQPKTPVSETQPQTI